MSRRTRGDDEATPLTPEETEEFKAVLLDKRQHLLGTAEGARKKVSADHDKLPDEVDLATAEYEAAFEYRLRDREKYLIKKIDKALRRIEIGEYDECESCGDIIARKRLIARPEATLCIICKEEQEQLEKGYLKARKRREEEFRF